MASHITIVYKVKHALHKYFPQNLRSWKGVAIYLGKYVLASQVFRRAMHGMD